MWFVSFQFVKLIGLDQERFHITGVSMGGALSGLFAATYPELVTAVTLTCPSSEYFHFTIHACTFYSWMCFIPVFKAFIMFNTWVRWNCFISLFDGSVSYLCLMEMLYNFCLVEVLNILYGRASFFYLIDAGFPCNTGILGNV